MMNDADYDRLKLEALAELIGVRGPSEIGVGNVAAKACDEIRHMKEERGCACICHWIGAGGEQKTIGCGGCCNVAPHTPLWGAGFKDEAKRVRDQHPPFSRKTNSYNQRDIECQAETISRLERENAALRGEIAGLKVEVMKKGRQ